MRAALSCLVLLLLLQGCGFQPIHGAKSPAAAKELAKFDIELIADRTGQLLREELLIRFRPDSDRTARAYTLAVTVMEEEEGLGVRFDAVPTRGSYKLTANFNVLDNSENKVIFTGKAYAQSNYDILKSEFATLSGRAGARSRAIKALADEIANRVYVWLLRRELTLFRS